MSKEDLKVKPVDQEVTNDDLRTIHGGAVTCKGPQEKPKGCGSRD